MNTEQKIAWFTLTVCGVTIIAYGILHVLYGYQVAFAAFSILGLTGFIPILFPKRQSNHEVTVDERDRIILRKANVAAGMVSYLIFVLVTMGAWFYQFAHGARHIGISVLPMIVMCGGLGLFVTRSIALIVLYRTDTSYGEG